ncbi:MAG TPA: RNA methyltransferase substrate-binding domain-containing protein, partial [Amycolatopsis sp.]|nr:RNA methyltransferase substrate-binding domain-containing protein [Amycolatopsis sp.]
MAGNSRRQGAIRKPGTKKGQVVGSGGQRRKGLEGKGPTPKAEDRPGHKAYRMANARDRKDQARQKKADKPELIAGRNPVVEALRADVPATALYVAINIEIDDRVNEAVRLAGDKGISILEIPREELDRKTNRAMHQGLGLQVPPFVYADPRDLMAVAKDSGQTPLFVALDGVTDPRNLGAVIRSAAAFGAQG